MKFETLNSGKSRFWKRFSLGISLFVIALFGIFTFYASFAKYKVTTHAHLADGNIEFSKADFSLISLNVEENNTEELVEENQKQYKPSDKVPTDGNYSLNENKSYCTAGENKTQVWGKGPDGKQTVSGSTITVEFKDGSLTFSNVTERNTRCYLWFDKEVKKVGTSESTLASLKLTASAESVCPSLDQDGNANITAIATSNDTVTDSGKSRDMLCKARDDYGDSYYFRGVVEKNWVKIGTTYWRIIRINGDGTIRLIYNGTKTDTTGDTTMAFNGAYKEYNKDPKYNDNAYVGFMYGKTGQKGNSSDTTAYDNTHANQTKSDIMSVLESWIISSEFPQQYLEILDGHAGFCNDRTPYQYSGINANSKMDKVNYGMGTTPTYYGAYYRTNQSNYPTLQCPNPKNDLFTTVGNDNGNQKLQYAVGLITADEVEYAGAYRTTTNKSYYLYNGRYYWTMSPFYFLGSSAGVFYVYSDGYLNNWYVSSTIPGVRPVINLKADTKFKADGDGSKTAPFTVQLS